MSNVLSSRHRRVRKMRAQTTDPSRAKAARERTQTRRAERNAKKGRKP